MTTAHGMLGHIDNAMVRKTCEYFGYQISRGKDIVCKSCREAKSRKEAIPKDCDQDISIVPNQLIWLDLEKLKVPKNCK